MCRRASASVKVRTRFPQGYDGSPPFPLLFGLTERGHTNTNMRSRAASQAT